MAAEKIEHSFLPIRGLNLHIAHTGSGELGSVVFLHGFPEIWYSWRHQMLAVAGAGYRAIAPDLRGYGLSEQPPEPEKAAWEDLVADLLALLDALSIPKAFIVGKDFGAVPAYQFALYHPDRVCGVISLGIPFSLTKMLDEMPEGFYILRWREPGRAEVDFGRFDAKRVVRTIYTLFSRAEIPIAKEGQEILDLADSSTPLPEWFTEEDLSAYAALYEKSGFRYPLHMPYRALNKAIAGDAMDLRIETPVLLVMGERDYVYKFTGCEEYMKSGEMKEVVPNLEVIYIPEGSHFVQEQLPDQVNQLILGFLKDHPVVAQKFEGSV